MRILLRLARASLWSRRVTVFLTVLSVATSFALLVSVERLRSSARTSFESTISGTDLLVGSRGSGLQLLLYSVFRLGEPVQELSWEGYEAIAAHPEVAWSVPLALGDSVRGYRVLGTSNGYFEHYRYGEQISLELDGHAFEDDHQAVLGAEVASALGWGVGDRFPIQHGVTEDAHAHEHHTFEVVGILAPTGTPVDRTVHVPLSGLAAAHHEPSDHTTDDAHAEVSADGHGEHNEHAEHENEHNEHEHEEHGHHEDGNVQADSDGDGAAAPKGDLDQIESVSAVLIGLRSKMGLFRMRAWINDFPDEPLMAVMPARAFQRLWSTVGVAESTLLIVGILVSLAGVIALVATLLATVNERRREMALLRSVGASPIEVGGLIVGEALLVAASSVLVALAAVYGLAWLGRSVLVSQFGLRMSAAPVTAADLPWVAAFLLAALVASLIPAWMSYRRSLSDGLLVRT